MKKAVIAAVLVAAFALLAAVAALGGPQKAAVRSDMDATTLAVYGDSPYGTSNADVAQFNATPAFIDTINQDPSVSLVMHVGDIHSGKQKCTQAYDQSIFADWKAFADPLVYTPGDNEWTDCHKTAEGGGLWNSTTSIIDFQYDSPGVLTDFAAGNPVANLLLVRSIFFPTPGVTLGQNTMKVHSQALEYDPAHPSDRNYVENVWWERSNVLFVTINLPGGSNNDDDNWYGTPTKSQDQIDEVAQRTGADLRWLDTAFAKAKADKVSALVIGAQADMWDTEKGAAHQANYEPIVTKVSDLTKDLGKPVLMINGDSHVYRSDNPFSSTGSCATEGGSCTTHTPADIYAIHPTDTHGNAYDVPNFHRIVVHGSTAPMEWLKLKVDPKQNDPNGVSSFGPFSWTRVGTGLG